MFKGACLRVPSTSRIRELRRSKFVRDALSLSIGKGANLAMGMLSTLIFGFVFAKTDIAMLSLFEMLVQLILAFGVNWSAAGVTRFGKGELKVGESLCYTSSTRLYIAMPIVAVASLLLLVFQGPVLDYLGASQPALIWYLIGSLVVATLHDQVSAILATRERHAANAKFYVAEGAAKLLILAAFLSGLVEVDVLWYVAASFWLSLAILMFRLPTCGRSFLYPLCRVNAEDLKTFLRYTVPQMYGFAGIFLVNWIDVYFIRRYCTLEDLGAYQFLYSIFLKFAMFAIVANTLLFPRVMAWKLENPDAVSRFTRTVPQIVLLLAMLGCGLLLVVFPPLFGVFFADKYEAAYPSFALMLCSLPCYFLSHVFVPVLNSFDRVKYVQTVNIISAGCNLIVDFLLVPRHGIIGAAMGTFVAYWVKVILLMLPVQASFGIKWRLISFLCAVLAAFAGVQYLFDASLWPAGLGFADVSSIGGMTVTW